MKLTALPLILTSLSNNFDSVIKMDINVEMLDTEDLITKERDQLYATLQVRATLRHSWQPIGISLQVVLQSRRFEMTTAILQIIDRMSLNPSHYTMSLDCISLPSVHFTCNGGNAFIF